MVNLRKCYFLVAQAAVLGMDISCALCSLGDKYLKCWLQVHLPCTLAELQSIVGKLVWASGLIPNFKEEIGPVEALLSCKDTAAM